MKTNSSPLIDTKNTKTFLRSTNCNYILLDFIE